MALLVGTSGWFYEDWKGTVYSEGLPENERLPWLAARLPTGEVNVTFYRTPSAKVVEDWLRKVEDVPRFEFFTQGAEGSHAGPCSEGQGGRRIPNHLRVRHFMTQAVFISFHHKEQANIH